MRMESHASNSDAQHLVTKRELAAILRLSPRTIENLAKRRAIPVCRISARCVRYAPDAVLRALGRFTINEVT